MGIIIISDRVWRGQRCDESGTMIKECISKLPFEGMVAYDIVPDEREIISAKLREWVDDRRLKLIFTSGGTGLAPRDVTPEATMAVIERIVPGLAEAMRMETIKKTPASVLSRAVVGTRGESLIINLPGSPDGAKECLEVILPVLPHALEILSGKVMEGPHSGGC